jgi:16S rRNA (adenine1518-N6/adenine1519-N6)-dimethyltransferase
MINLPSTAQMIKKYQLDAKKSLGQNFIIDKNFTDKIVKNCGNIINRNIIEIGAGPGSLTRSILDANPRKLIVIEKDNRAIAILREIQDYYGDKLEIIEHDATLIDINSIFPNQRFSIIANLPYNIGTVLLFQWLRNLENIDSMHLMLQKEVCQRIAAKVNENNYSRLSIIANWLCNTRIVFEVPPHIFTPPPKVYSAIIELIPKRKLLDCADFDILEDVIAKIFNYRRKMIKSALKQIFSNIIDNSVNLEKILEEIGINGNLRAENITIEQFIRIANFVKSANE